MDFRKLASKAGRALDLSRRTDSEIRRAYDQRYDNPNIKGWQRRLLEEEAERRNID